MFARGRYAAASCLAAVALSGVAGCSGSGDRPQTLPPLSTTPAATSSPEPSAGPKADLAAISAVIRTYYRLLNAPTTLANADAIARLMTSDCPCQRVADSTRSVARRGEHYFGKTSLVSISPNLDDANTGDALVEYGYSSGGIKDAAGNVVTRTPGRHGALLTFAMVKKNGRWLIRNVVTVRRGRP